MEFYTVAEVAEILKLGINQTRSLVQRDDFPKIKFGRIYRIPKEEFTAWVHKSIGKYYSI